MGMAVDANVLIYERMREEARLGRSTIAAFESGFKLALATIVDSHLTALIAAIALFALGSGPIRGFAVAFAIGIICTLFTAYLLTRLIVSTWVRQTRPEDRAALGSRDMPLRLIPDDTNIPFMKLAKIRTPISLALIVAVVRAALHRRPEPGHRLQGRHRHRGAQQGAGRPTSPPSARR